MPTKRNRAGNQQEYNESNGEYTEGTSGSGGSTGATAQTASKTPTKKQSTQQKGESWEDWATRLDKDVASRGWEPDGFDGDTRFYDFEGGSASINPSGYTTLYDEDYNTVEFSTPEEAYEFLEITNKEEAEEYVWDHVGEMTSNAEDYIEKKFADQEPTQETQQETQADDSDETYVMRRNGPSTKEKSFKIRNEKGELEDRNAWAKRIDNTAEQNGWKPYDWDGETSRLYKTPKGWASIYMSGRVELFEKWKDTQWFTSLEEASNYINEDNKATSKSVSAADDFDNDLDKAYEKYDGDENAILDELRKKDYGMSNGDLQSVVEAYVMRKDTDKAKKLFGLKDFAGKK